MHLRSKGVGRDIRLIDGSCGKLSDDLDETVERLDMSSASVTDDSCSTHYLNEFGVRPRKLWVHCRRDFVCSARFGKPSPTSARYVGRSAVHADLIVEG